MRIFKVKKRTPSLRGNGFNQRKKSSSNAQSIEHGKSYGFLVFSLFKKAKTPHRNQYKVRRLHAPDQNKERDRMTGDGRETRYGYTITATA